MSEKKIIAGCIKNDYESQKVLFDKYVNTMKTLCLRYAGDEAEAEDILQEGFIIMFTKIKDFQFKGSFEGWLRKIMINVALRHLKKKNRKFIEDIDTAYGLYDETPNVVSDLSEKELLNLLSKLPEGYRVVFNMFVIEGYSHKEIATELNIGVSTSRSQLAKAKGTLRKLIEELY